MHIMHVALGGCLKAPPVDFGITQDTGGHIAYILGAAAAQAKRDAAARVTIVTRAFDDPALGAVHALEFERVAERLHVRRLRTAEPRYLTKAALVAELPALREAFARLVDEDPPDVVHAHFADAFDVAVDAARRHGARLLYTPHSLSLNKQRCTDVPARERSGGTRRAGDVGDPRGGRDRRLVRGRGAPSGRALRSVGRRAVHGGAAGDLPHDESGYRARAGR